MRNVSKFKRLMQHMFFHHYAQILLRAFVVSHTHPTHFARTTTVMKLTLTNLPKNVRFIENKGFF